MKFKNGSSNVFFIMFILVFIIITVVTVEFYYMFTVKEHIDTELSRALNIATDSAMLDEYRMEHISMIHIPTAVNEFDSYLHNEMKLNASNERVEGGKVKYKLVITDTQIEQSPASYQVSGYVRVKPVLLSNLVPIDIDIPFKAKARNQRFE